MPRSKKSLVKERIAEFVRSGRNFTPNMRRLRQSMNHLLHEDLMLRESAIESLLQEDPRWLTVVVFIMGAYADHPGIFLSCVKALDRWWPYSCVALPVFYQFHGLAYMEICPAINSWLANHTLDDPQIREYIEPCIESAPLLLQCFRDAVKIYCHPKTFDGCIIKLVLLNQPTKETLVPYLLVMASLNSEIQEIS